MRRNVGGEVNSSCLGGRFLRRKAEGRKGCEEGVERDGFDGFVVVWCGGVLRVLRGVGG
jgi:hypothetical protein